MATLSLAYKVRSYSTGTPGRALCNTRTQRIGNSKALLRRQRGRVPPCWPAARTHAIFPSLLSRKYAIDPHHTPGDQGLKAVR